MNDCDVIVVGGGPAGILAAYTAAQGGARVVLLEKNEKLGKKLYITGKGRCNVTNDCDADEFRRNVVHGERFLYSALSHWSPRDTADFLESRGVPVKAERGNRVFPASDKSSDVIKALTVALQGAGVDVRLHTPVTAVLVHDSAVTGVKTTDLLFNATKVIVATGGLSYPLTGSTGDGYRFAKALGHTLVPPVPALCALVVAERDDLEGLSLKNVTVSYTDGKCSYASEIGEMLFTDDGVSGPLILTLSSYINTKMSGNGILRIDLKPALTEAQLDARLLRDFAAEPNKQLKNSLFDLLPRRLISVIIERAKVNPELPINVLPREGRLRLVQALKGLPFTVLKAADIETAVVTAGGVSTAEINPKNMESKRVKGLHFCGEVLDIDALTGGFNIQLALATGRAAGQPAV
ncbi:MAG: NAD(P)/FAD-dependent oxidoreductase [Clostridiales bacterium]|jgi:predicted Rossmann fold flavoprotein|nr:NAD(P)/FAD-dependent oxidoreductase [Clostridiales bacterium]